VRHQGLRGAAVDQTKARGVDPGAGELALDARRAGTRERLALARAPMAFDREAEIGPLPEDRGHLLEGGPRLGRGLRASFPEADRRYDPEAETRHRHRRRNRFVPRTRFFLDGLFLDD